MSKELIVKVTNESEFKKVMKLAHKNGYGFPWDVHTKTYNPILKLFEKEVSINIKNFCLIFDFDGRIEYQTASYCKEFYFCKISNFEQGMDLLANMRREI